MGIHRDTACVANKNTADRDYQRREIENRMSYDEEVRKQVERKREEKKNVMEWMRDPVRGKPVAGTGKHHGERGNGTPYSNLRRRHLLTVGVKVGEDNRRAERLIGGHRPKRYKGRMMTAINVNRKMARKISLSHIDDSTFYDYENLPVNGNGKRATNYYDFRGSLTFKVCEAYRMKMN
ncbi:MAG: hypothetical protein WC663_05815 [Patescibacteria group bacterium]